MKHNRQYTINVDENHAALIEKLAAHYKRKPAEMLRLLLEPVLVEEYAKTQRQAHKENTQPIQPAIFKN